MRDLAKGSIQTCLAVLAIGVLASFAHASPTLQVSSNAGSTINFNGTNSTFNFTNSSGTDFKVTSEIGGSAAVGLLGTISGTYTIGSITTVAGVSTAPVTGSGVISISDGSANFTASVDWMNITQVGTGGNLNLTGLVNLTNLSYSGSNADLQAIAAEPDGVATLSFTFVPAVSLTTLATGGGTNSTSYSGTIVGVPEPASLSLWLCGGLVGFFGRRRFAARRAA